MSKSISPRIQVIALIGVVVVLRAMVFRDHMGSSRAPGISSSLALVTSATTKTEASNPVPEAEVVSVPQMTVGAPVKIAPGDTVEQFLGPAPNANQVLDPHEVFLRCVGSVVLVRTFAKNGDPCQLVRDSLSWGRVSWSQMPMFLRGLPVLNMWIITIRVAR